MRLESIIFALLLFYYFIITKVCLLVVRNKNSSSQKDILYLENFPIENAGYQYRTNKWKSYFEAKGLIVEIWTIEESKLKFENYLSCNRNKFRKYHESRLYKILNISYIMGLTLANKMNIGK